jgi:hypothetical protein
MPTPQPPLIGQPRWHVPVGRRPCVNHPATPAVDRCDRCGQPFCAACLQPVDRWRICTACLAGLARERTGLPLGERLRTFWPAALAVLVIGAMLTGGVLAIDRGMRGAADATPLVGSAKKVGCLQHYPDPGKLYVVEPVGGLPLYGAPPGRLVVENCDFQPGEDALIAGDIWGYDFHGQPFSEQLGPVRSRVGDDGVFVATVGIPQHTGFEGAYRITLHATGDAGSAAVAYLNAEGNTVPPTRAAGG